MASYQYFLPKRLEDLQQDTEVRMTVTSLEEGKHKYEGKIVDARVSSDPAKYPDTLRLRFAKGQLHEQPWSMETVREIDPIPPEFK